MRLSVANTSMSMALSSGFGPVAIVNALVAWDTSHDCAASRSTGIVGGLLKHADPLRDPRGVLVREAHDRELRLQQSGGSLLGGPVAEQRIGDRAPRQQADGDQQHEQNPRARGEGES